ncbi:MAG: DUF3126 family protein [Pseudomonadota bacterium]|nr:hypothetical protein [Alphaproteobacteria bacterium]MEC7577066.1 DUF3126 family protein [Pseudomonadota bacterium]MCS5596455.1 DUF3126 family protein [Alphaproteobacteria bacterium]MEC7703458.1 DUF3126 family protein [Pseudomonadota bacterium]MEC9236632.1 DUF3126 family protein [Pseudomonadota bacterium]|tara:strand:- start:3552 stop:3770 length:219 start_codon:yes stop_codon:yes gene_type:complete
MSFSGEEITRVQKTLQKRFSNDAITLRRRDKADDSVEVYMDGEFIAVVYKDEDEGEVSFDFNMAILPEDLLK